MLENLFGIAIEADPAAWFFRGRREEGPEFLIDVAQGRIVDEDGFINLGQALQDGGIGGEFFAHLYEGTDDVLAHLDSARAVENRGRHEGTVFGEGEWQLAAAAMGTGRKLRPVLCRSVLGLNCRT
jgi:hypothetical protein